MKYNGKILIIGCGGVSQCTVPLILKHIDLPPQNVTIMDYVDNRARVQDALKRGVKYVSDRVTRENYSTLLSKYVDAGDLLIDLAWDIDTMAMLQ
jgi:homospermidine synthase